MGGTNIVKIKILEKDYKYDDSLRIINIVISYPVR